MTWFAFLGAWLLVAGALYQATLELQAEENATARVRELTATVEAPPPVPSWWWAVPPVALALRRRRQKRYRQLVIDAMSDEDMDVHLRFVNVAAGWAYVGLGALLLAVRETDALVEENDWPPAAFPGALATMAALCVGNTIARHRRTRRELTGHHAARVAAGRTSGPPARSVPSATPAAATPAAAGSGPRSAGSAVGDAGQ